MFQLSCNVCSHVTCNESFKKTLNLPSTQKVGCNSDYVCDSELDSENESDIPEKENAVILSSILQRLYV